MAQPGNYAVCIVGLGSMGMGAATSCINAGLTTYGVDLNPQALAALQQAGANGPPPAQQTLQPNWMRCCCWWLTPTR